MSIAVGVASFGEVAGVIRNILRGQGLSRTLAIGELLLSKFFNGDESEWKERRSKKNNSIRRLAARTDCPLGKSALNEAIGVYAAVRHLPFVLEASHIGASHVAAVLRLDQQDRERFLKLAERERWSVRELRTRTVEDRRSHGEKRGRPTLSNGGRVFSQLRSSVKQLREGLAALEETATDGTDYTRLLAETLTELDRARELLQAHMRGDRIRLVQTESTPPRAVSNSADKTPEAPHTQHVPLRAVAH